MIGRDQRERFFHQILFAEATALVVFSAEKKSYITSKKFWYSLLKIMIRYKLKKKKHFYCQREAISSI